MILWVLYFLIFISGLFIGSFLNVVSDRVVNGKSIVLGRSVCDFCGRVLGALELIPVVSYLIQLGKCKVCKKKLSWLYPLSEFLTGITFFAVAYNLDIFNPTNNWYIWVIFAYFLIVSSFLIVLFLADIKYYLLPNKVMFPAIIFVVVFILLNVLFSIWFSHYQMSHDNFGKYLIEAGYWRLQSVRLLMDTLYTVLSSIGIFIFFWLLTLIKDGKAMGGGDVKLAFLIGLIVGFPNNILAIFLGFFTGALTSLALIALRKKTMKDIVPFGPFLIVGCFIALFWGEQILTWYFSIF